MSPQPLTTIKAFAGKLTAVVSAIALSIFIWSGSAIVSNSIAHADSIHNVSSVVAVSGIKEGVEGAVDKGVGSVKRATGDMRDDPVQETKGAIQQAKGDAKMNVGDAKNKLDDAKDTVEQKSESIIDSVKDFFD